MLRRVLAVRYVTPLREGGSLPGIVEGDDLGTYVAKFRGAGQGLPVLVTEVVYAGLARLLDIPTPEVVVLDLPPELARYEADEEVQDLLRASVGSNLGVDFLPGALPFDRKAPLDATLAARLLWLDAFTANPDRTWSNPNMLLWHGQPWAIDAGAALYFHFAWPSRGPDAARFAAQPYDARGHLAGGHVTQADIEAADAAARAALTPDALAAVLADVPDEWLVPGEALAAHLVAGDADPHAPASATPGPDAVRALYVDHLTARLASVAWVPDADGIGDVTPRAHSNRPGWLR